MKNSIRDDQYQNLEELRYHIRLFVQQSEKAARSVGVEHQQYQVLLALRGVLPGRQCTIRVLSERLLLKHHSTVELIDRMEPKRLVIRSRDQKDHRQVLVRLQPKGERLLAAIVRQRLNDLSTEGRKCVEAMNLLLEKSGATGAGRRSQKSAAGRTQEKPYRGDSR